MISIIILIYFPCQLLINCIGNMELPYFYLWHPCYENNGVTDFDASGCHFSSTTLAWLLYGSIPVFIRIF